MEGWTIVGTTAADSGVLKCVQKIYVAGNAPCLNLGLLCSKADSIICLPSRLVADANFGNSDQVVGFLEAVDNQLRRNKDRQGLYNFLFSLEYFEPRYSLRLGGKDIRLLSPGEKGALLLVFYLLLDPEEIPIIIDQPEQNLDNESVVKLLVDCIRRARERRQVIIVTHNPNLAIVCDADQLIRSEINKNDGNLITYEAGAIEESELNRAAVNILEGTYVAFNNRQRKYHDTI